MNLIKHRFKYTVLFYLIPICGLCQTTIDINGTVKDAWGNPVTQCQVSLESYGIQEATNSQGVFQIQGDFSPVEEMRIWDQGLSRLKGSALEFSIQNFRETVQINLFDFKGRHLKEVLNRSMIQGEYKIYPLTHIQSTSSHSIYIVNITLGKHQAFYKMHSFIEGSFKKVIEEISENSRFKKAAPVDSLTILCTGNLEQRIQISTFTDSIHAIVSPLWDMVVYGGTSAAIIAAVQAKKMNKSVVVISPDKRLGGLSSGGLGQTDIGNKQAIGGLSLNYYERMAQKYGATGSQWTFEPKVALEIFHDHVRENNLPIVYERLELNNGVTKLGTRIQSMKTETGNSFSGKIFIDATYEGDLMAKAGVSYFIGREPNSLYNETLSGVQVAQARYHQLQTGVDPYVIKGDPNSGLLSGIDPTGPGQEGGGDNRVQAYNFRMTLTDATANMVAVQKPVNYNELEYELLFRHIELGGSPRYFKFSMMPNRKTDSNNEGGFSTDYIGQNYDYPDGDYVTREKIIKAHETYQKGFLWTLQNHTRIPANVKTTYSAWGLPRDEFIDNGNWSPQLYIREARRMIGKFVMTERNVRQQDKVSTSVGMGAYTMDSHHMQRYIDNNGFVKNEGDVQVGGFGPYPIDYGSIVPKKSEITNLFVPVCLSATHIAFGSIRMEPVFMILGQSAATAAAHSIDEGVDVQDVDYPKLYNRLVADNQVLGLVPPIQNGIIIDDSDANLTGSWLTSSSVTPLIGSSYQHDNNANKGNLTATFQANISEPGIYEVRFFFTANANRATNVSVTVNHAGGNSIYMVNQQQVAVSGYLLGDFTFNNSGSVVVSNQGSNGFVVIDGIQFIKK